MAERKLRTSVILKTLTEIQTNYDEDSDEWLTLEKAKDLFFTMNKIRVGLARAALLDKDIISN